MQGDAVTRLTPTHVLLRSFLPLMCDSICSQYSSSGLLGCSEQLETCCTIRGLCAARRRGQVMSAVLTGLRHHSRILFCHDTILDMNDPMKDNRVMQ